MNAPVVGEIACASLDSLKHFKLNGLLELMAMTYFHLTINSYCWDNVSMGFVTINRYFLTFIIIYV